MGAAKRRRAGVSVAPEQPAGDSAPGPIRCTLTPGPVLEQTGQDGVVYHVQVFHLTNGQGQPLGIRTVLVTPGAPLGRA